MIVKPARQGSSVGITIAKNKKALEEAIDDALMYDEKILVEKVVENLFELNCSVLGDNSSFEASLMKFFLININTCLIILRQEAKAWLRQEGKFLPIFRRK